MDKYLLEILKDVNTIIIPGLGALTLTNKDTGEIMFMPYLKHDDGKLCSYISEKEGMDENESKNLIAKYVREIQMVIDKGESYDMFEFGTFSKNEDGDIEFNNWNKTAEGQQATETKKEESPDPKPAKVEEEKVAVTKDDKKSKAAEEKKAKAEAKEKQKAEALTAKVKAAEEAKKKKEETDQKAAAAAKEKADQKAKEKAEKVTDSKAKVVPITKAAEKELNIEEKEEISKNVEKLDKLKKQKEEKKEKKKRGAGFYILMTLIVIIIGGGTLVTLNYDSIKQHIPFLADDIEKTTAEHDEINKMKEMMGEEEAELEDIENSDDEAESDMGAEVEETNEATSEDEVIQDEEPIKEEVITTPEPAPKSKPVNSSNPYHIVAGVFSNSENAEKLASSLSGQGYYATTFVRGNMTVVSMNSYSTNAEATAALQNARNDSPKAWVLFWK